MLLRLLPEELLLPVNAEELPHVMIQCDYQTGTETIRVWYPQHSLIDITIHGDDIVEYSYHVLLKGNKKLIEDKLPDFIFFLVDEYGLDDRYQKLSKLFPEIQQ